MGNLHNLFGDTNVVHIQMTPKGYQIQYLVKGDTIGEVLGYVQYSGEDLLEKLRRHTEEALQYNRMMGSDRPATFAYQNGDSYTDILTGFFDLGDDIVSIILHIVVFRGIEVSF